MSELKSTSSPGDAGSRVAVVDIDSLPEFFPTHRHDPSFWEMLGRTIATFGFLEEILAKAIFAFTGTVPCTAEDAEAALKRWLEVLQRTLSHPLNNLIDLYVKYLKEHPEAAIENIGDLEARLREAARLRNALCHGSWRLPNERGASALFYFEKSGNSFDTKIDVGFLTQTQRAVAELSTDVIDSVTRMGWQFPGSDGPGKTLR